MPVLKTISEGIISSQVNTGLTNTDHILEHKENNKFHRVEIMQPIFLSQCKENLKIETRD